jgi:hypothetical protein
LSWADSQTAPFKEVVRQQWNFNPRTSPEEIEDYSAKWISEDEVLIDLESGFTETKNFDSFDFSLRALVRGDGKTLSTKFGRSPAAQ